MEDPGSKAEGAAEANPVVVPEVKDTDEWARRLDYYRWSCEQLNGLLAEETERWSRLEGKTVHAVTVAGGAAAVVLGLLRPPYSAGGFFVVVTTIATVVALGWASKAMFLKPRPAPSVQDYTVDDNHGETTYETEADWLTRTNRVRVNLAKAVGDARTANEEKAKDVQESLRWCLIAVLMMVVVLVQNALWAVPKEKP